MLLHCPVRGRTRLRLPDFRRTIFHLQVPRPDKLGAGNIMAVRLVESHRPDCRSCVDRVWLRPTAPSGCLNGRGLQWLCAHGPADRWGHGRFYGTSRCVEQSEHSSARKDDQDICHFPYCRLIQLLRRTSGNVRLQAYFLLHLDHGRQ